MKYLWLLLLMGCGRIPAIDPKLQPYVNSFLASASAHSTFIDSSRIDVHFVDNISGGDVVGQCEMSTGVVSINNSFWDLYNEIQHENIVWHELGHCLLFRFHKFTFINIYNTQEPTSIMFPRMLDWGYYEDHHNSYATELFAYKNLGL